MPRKLPPYCECWRDRHGRLRIYFRKAKGQRIPLPVDVASDAFAIAYQAALAGQLEQPSKRLVRAATGTIGALIISYMQSAPYIGLRDTTRAGYASGIETLRVQHGHRTIAGLSRAEAAQYVGIGSTKFDELVATGRMPKPKRIDSRKVWDIQELDMAFDALPGDTAADNTWSDVDAA